MELKNKLLETKMIKDNEYFDLYVNLVTDNLQTEKQLHKTQSHHIIPRCYYDMNDRDVDDSSVNLVNLLYKDHILAHYYLSLCSIGLLHDRMAYAMILIANTRRADIDSNFIESLNKYQELYEENMKILADKARKRFSGIKQSSEHVQKRVAKNTGKKRTESTRQKISKSQKGKTVTEESKAKMRAAQKKYAAIETEEHKNKRVERFKETMAKKTDEWKFCYREKLSKATTGRPLGENECLHKSQAMSGRKLSEEHKLNLSRRKSKYIYYYNNTLFESEKEMIQYLNNNGVDITYHTLRNIADGKGRSLDMYCELLGEIKKLPNPKFNSINSKEQ